MKNWLLSIFWIVSLVSKAQQPYMWQLTDDDGLPSMEVFSVLQDKHGFIWAGTDNGICRYDGVRFKTYYHPKQRGKAFSHLQQDAIGRIWCVNFAGQIFIIENDSLKLYEPFERIQKTGFPSIQIIGNEIWIIASNQSLWYAHYNDTVLHQFKDLPKDSYLLTLAGSPLSKSIMVTGDSIYAIQKHKRIQTFTKKYDGLMHAPKMNAFLQFSVGKTNLKIDGYYKNNWKAINTQSLQSLQARVIKVQETELNEYWLLTYDGAHLFTIDNNNQCMLKLSILKGNAVSDVLKDREGNYWFTTLKNGIMVMPSKEVWLLNTNNSSLPDNRVTRIESIENGNLVIGTGQGYLNQFNPHNAVISTKLKLNNTQQDIELLQYNPRTQKLMVLNADLYAVNQQLNQFKIEPSLSAVKHLSYDGWGNALVSNAASCMFIPSTTGNQSPYCQLYPANSMFNSYKAHVFRNQRSNCNLFNEHDTSIWIAFTDGVYIYQKGKHRVLTSSTGDTIFATYLHKAPDNTIWISTVQQGIFAFKNGKQVKQLTTKDGLISNHVRKIKTSAKTLWIVTDKGVQGYHSSTGAFYLFAKADGLVTTDVLDIFVKDQTVYLATTKGLQWFNETASFVNKIPPLVTIESVLVNDELSLKTGSTLDYSQNNISFTITGIAFKSRGAFTYWYRLNGLDSNWKKAASSENNIRFVSVPPGQYIFEVVTINEDGIRSLTPARFNFAIATPYWQRWWFIALLLLSIIVFVSFVFLLRMKQIAKRNKLQSDKKELEMALRTSQLSALKVQMNPHFIFNALNSIQEYILTNEKKLANSYLGKFSDLMRIYLDMSNQTQVLLSAELKAMRLYLELEAMRFEDNFEYNLHVSEQLAPDEIQIPAMIIQPYIENALKHGLLHKRTDRKLAIWFKEHTERTIVCEIRDNGIGRKQSMELNAIRNKSYTSFATRATEKRLELLNAGLNDPIGIAYDDLLHHDGQAAGTRVVITIPIVKKESDI
ncbi:MAG: histidine kinase [Bacteroidia bacterium]|jgi:ligand-binding sensor domain-containing protein|nr:histidine kinase [Bacteroidia bacterium]